MAQPGPRGPTVASLVVDAFHSSVTIAACAETQAENLAKSR